MTTLKRKTQSVDAGTKWLIIFDCDGVLVDSEPLAEQIFSAQLAKYGVFEDATACRKKYKGYTLRDCIASINQEYQIGLGQEFLMELKLTTEQGFSRALKPVAGIHSVLDWLANQPILICVASNGERKKIEHSLALTTLDKYFENIFSADDVNLGKPAPDLFLLAARTCGAEPEYCIVIEDSKTGVEAAQAAGMQVLFFNDDSLVLEGIPNIVTFTRMSQLPALLEAARLR